jgi:hypothetical protein
MEKTEKKTATAGHGPFLIGFYTHETPEEIEEWLDEHGIKTTLTRWCTEIPEDDNEDCVVSVRVRWDSVEDEVKYSADLRRHIALLNQDATQEAEVYYGFNHAEYAWWSCPHDLLDMHLGSTFIIRTGPE